VLDHRAWLPSYMVRTPFEEATTVSGEPVTVRSVVGAELVDVAGGRGRSRRGLRCTRTTPTAYASHEHHFSNAGEWPILAVCGWYFVREGGTSSLRWDRFSRFGYDLPEPAELRPLPKDCREFPANNRLTNPP
jgi:hypothetical protein